MKLHTKLSLALLSGLILVVAIAQFIQYSKAIELITGLSNSNISTIKEREEGFARNIFSSVDRAVAGSLERGEMEKFNSLIAAQKTVEGLIEFSLYDKEGIISHSSDSSCLQRPLPEDIRERLLGAPELLFRHIDNTIEIYRPQMITDECIRCHYTWEPGKIGGVTSIKVSTEALSKARLHAAETLSQAKRTFLLNCLLTLGGIIAFFVLTMYLSVSRFIRRPLERITNGFKDLSEGEGDLTRQIEIVSRDELGELVRYFNVFLEKLKSMVGQIQRSGVQVTSSSTELAATAKQQEVTLKSQLESTKNVLTSVEGISSVAQDLVHTMQQVASMSQDTAGLAGSGKEDLAKMGEAMGGMEKASRSISGRLEAINEKAENITTVVTTISSVAAQTNLLSLNAAIEAEKAGNYGRGFMVVAREIRRLADQTAVSTLDIDQMVKEMQSAVSAGVMEMDRFIAKVRQNVEDVHKISAQLTRIIEQVQALSPNFESVNSAMELHSRNAGEIKNAMASVNDEMQQTIGSLRESFLAIGQLNEAARGLQEEVSRFKVA
jgi:methyl-accepting chemotaxis protein